MEEDFDNDSISGIYHLRTWELNGDSTRYDTMVAAPSDSDLTNQWLGWAIFAGLSAFATGALLLSLLTHPKNRNKDPFLYLYLIYMIIPDFVFSFLCVITCTMNHINGGYWSIGMCKFQSVYITFVLGANAWLSAAVIREIHQMLLMSSTVVAAETMMDSSFHSSSSAESSSSAPSSLPPVSAQIYKAPSSKQITAQAMVIYFLSLTLGIFAISDGVIPVEERLLSGLACLPADYDHVSALFFYGIFMPLLALIPIGYVLYVFLDVYWKDLLPPASRIAETTTTTAASARSYSVFFGRLVVVYLLFWIPTVLFIFVLPPVTSQWATWVSGSWSHLEGFASVCVVLTTATTTTTTRPKEISQGFWDLVCCRGCSEDGADGHHDQEGRGTACHLDDTGRTTGGEEDISESTSTIRKGGDQHHQAIVKKNKTPYPAIGQRRHSFKRIDASGAIISELPPAAAPPASPAVPPPPTSGRRPSTQSLLSDSRRSTGSILNDLSLHSLKEDLNSNSNSNSNSSNHREEGLFAVGGSGYGSGSEVGAGHNEDGNDHDDDLEKQLELESMSLSEDFKSSPSFASPVVVQQIEDDAECKREEHQHWEDYTEELRVHPGDNNYEEEQEADGNLHQNDQMEQSGGTNAVTRLADASPATTTANSWEEELAKDDDDDEEVEDCDVISLSSATGPATTTSEEFDSMGRIYEIDMRELYPTATWTRHDNIGTTTTSTSADDLCASGRESKRFWSQENSTTTRSTSIADDLCASGRESTRFWSQENSTTTSTTRSTSIADDLCASGRDSARFWRRHTADGTRNPD